MLQIFTRAHLVMFEGLPWSGFQEHCHLHNTQWVQPTMASHRDGVGKQHIKTRLNFEKKIGSTLKKTFIKLYYRLQNGGKGDQSVDRPH